MFPAWAAAAPVASEQSGGDGALDEGTQQQYLSRGELQRGAASSFGSRDAARWPWASAPGVATSALGAMGFVEREGDVERDRVLSGRMSSPGEGGGAWSVADAAQVRAVHALGSAPQAAAARLALPRTFVAGPSQSPAVAQDNGARAGGTSTGLKRAPRLETRMRLEAGTRVSLVQQDGQAVLRMGNGKPPTTYQLEDFLRSMARPHTGTLSAKTTRLMAALHALPGKEYAVP